MNSIRRATCLIAKQRTIVRLLSSEAASHSHGHAEATYGGHDAHKSLAQTMKDQRATLNDLPVPAGSWEEYHKKRNTGYNIILGLSIVSLVATYFIMKASHALYFHGKPDLKKIKINIE